MFEAAFNRRGSDNKVENPMFTLSKKLVHNFYEHYQPLSILPIIDYCGFYLKT